MAQISLTIRDSLLAKEVEAVAAMNGWTENIADENGQSVPNPVTKEQFFKKQIKAWARNQAVEHANRQALASVTVEGDN